MKYMQKSIGMKKYTDYNVGPLYTSNVVHDNNRVCKTANFINKNKFMKQPQYIK